MIIPLIYSEEKVFISTTLPLLMIFMGVLAMLSLTFTNAKTYGRHSNWKSISLDARAAWIIQEVRYFFVIFF